MLKIPIVSFRFVLVLGKFKPNTAVYLTLYRQITNYWVVEYLDLLKTLIKTNFKYSVLLVVNSWSNTYGRMTITITRMQRDKVKKSDKLVQSCYIMYLLNGMWGNGSMLQNKLLNCIENSEVLIHLTLSRQWHDI